jgi:hypothetical protein
VEQAVDFQTPRKPATVRGDGIASLNRAELTSLEELTVDTGDEGRPDVWKSFLGGNWNKLVALLALEAAILAVHDQCI